MCTCASLIAYCVSGSSKELWIPLCVSFSSCQTIHTDVEYSHHTGPRLYPQWTPSHTQRSSKYLITLRYLLLQPADTTLQLQHHSCWEKKLNTRPLTHLTSWISEVSMWAQEQTWGWFVCVWGIKTHRKKSDPTLLCSSFISMWQTCHIYML